MTHGKALPSTSRAIRHSLVHPESTLDRVQQSESTSPFSEECRSYEIRDE